MSNSKKYTPKEIFGILVVLSIIGGFFWGVFYLDRKSAQENCEASYRTSACLMRMVEEAKAKEAYEQQIKELNK